MSFIKKEPVLSAAAVLAFLSMFFVAPSPEYLSYIDFRTLALLFSLMTVVAGLKEIGLFRYLGSSLLAGMHSTRQLAFTLTALCFFSSMLITNDVSLITFVPFSILILHMAGLPELMIPVIVLQTIAANLGSMATPIGNPQNLYLYSSFGLSAGEHVHRESTEPVSLLFLRPLCRCACGIHAAVNGTLSPAAHSCRFSDEK